MEEGSAGPVQVVPMELVLLLAPWRRWLAVSVVVAVVLMAERAEPVAVALAMAMAGMV
jgi:hypothetical protein